jgi:hypothetical protein
MNAKDYAQQSKERQKETISPPISADFFNCLSSHFALLFNQENRV